MDLYLIILSVSGLLFVVAIVLLAAAVLTNGTASDLRLEAEEMCQRSQILHRHTEENLRRADDILHRAKNILDNVVVGGRPPEQAPEYPRPAFPGGPYSVTCDGQSTSEDYQSE